MSGRRFASIAAGLIVGAAVVVAPTPAASAPTTAAPVAGSSSTAGGFGLPQGSLGSALKTSASSDGGYGSVGNCAGYATNVGVGVYCYSGATGGVDLPSLGEQFPGMEYHTCRYYDIPTGMKAPVNKPGPGAYYLRACISEIDWDDPFGGDPKVTLAMVFVPESEPDPTEWDPTPLDEFLWNQVRQNYPVPFMTAWPTKIPRVNVPTWLDFRWLDEDLETAAHGPYADNQNGGPYLELQSNGVTMVAEAAAIRVAPQILDSEGNLMDEIECEVPPVSYDQDADPTPNAQRSDCFAVFEHSSAAAEELTPDDVPLPPRDPNYPLPMYVVNVEVDWHVEMTSGDETVNLGTHTFTAYQQIPVTEVTGLTGLES